MIVVAELIKRHTQIWERMMPWRPIWQDLADMMIPRKAQVSYKSLYGPRRQTERMLDETAVDAAQKLGATMQGSLTSPAAKWFGLAMRDQELRRLGLLNPWLEDCTSTLFDAFQDSNFNEEVQESYFDLSVFGISAIHMREKSPNAREWSGFHFEALQVGDYAIDENDDGEVDTLHRVLYRSARSIVRRWDAPAMKLGGGQPWERFKERAEKNPFEEIPVVHAVYPREDWVDTGRKRIGLGKKYASMYFLEELKIVLEEGGYDDFPYLVPRWSKQAGEVYGRGPGITALPTTLSLTKAIELDFKSWEKDLDPPLKAKNRGIVGRVKTTPAAMTIVSDMEAIAPLFDTKRLGSYQPTQIRVERMEEKIRKVFYYDQLQLPGGGAGDAAQNTYMSATEVEKRYQLMQRLLGPTLGRLQNEKLKPLVERGFRMMAERDALPDAPEAFKEQFATARKMPRLLVKYEGPLERAQRASELDGINRAWSLTAPIIEAEAKVGAQSEVLDVLQLDEVTRNIWTAAGTRTGSLRDPRKVKERRDQRAQAVAAEKEKQDQMNAAEAMGKAAPAAGAMRELQDAGMMPEGGPGGQQRAA